MKRIHRDIIEVIITKEVSYIDLKSQGLPVFYKKDIGFNPWNLYLAVDFLVHKGYIFIDPGTESMILKITDKGKHYYEVMLKGKGVFNNAGSKQEVKR